MKRNINEIYMCHDEVLYDLYNLKPETATYEIINGRPCFINRVKKIKYEAGFICYLPDFLDKRIVEGDFLSDIDAVLNKHELLEIYHYAKDYNKLLCLTNEEKYIMNILLDKYFYNSSDFSISLKEMEVIYRKSSLSTRNIVLNNYTFNKYIDILNSLCNKYIFIKTKPTFRKSCYCSNDIDCSQRILEIYKDFKESSNNIRFSYSFGIFGCLLKNSKRFSAICPVLSFNINFNQVKKNLVAMYISRLIYIEQGLRLKTYGLVGGIGIDIEDLLKFVDNPLNPTKTNKTRALKQIFNYAVVILKIMKKEGTIYGFRAVSGYRSLFSQKIMTEEEQEREKWFEEVDEFQMEKKEREPMEFVASISIYLCKADINVEA